MHRPCTYQVSLCNTIRFAGFGSLTDGLRARPGRTGGAGAPLLPLPYDLTTVLHYYLTTLLPYYITTLAPCYPTNPTTVLPYYRATVLPCYRASVLPCYRATVLPCYRTTSPGAPLQPHETMAAGGVAGAVSAVLSQPIDVVRANRRT